MGVRSTLRGPLSPEERRLLDRLVHAMGPRLLAYIRRAYGDRHDAEDIVAETFCRAACNIAVLRGSARQDLYLVTIARNLCRDRFRRQRPVSKPNDQLEQRADRASDPPQAVAATEQIQALREAVAKLPEGLREVVALRLSAGLKFEQIAELLHIPLGTALSRMHSAVRRLRETLRCAHES